VVGAMQQGFAQAGVAMGITPGALKPRTRNAVMTLLLPMIIVFATIIVAVVLGIVAALAQSIALGLLVSAVYALGMLAAGVIGFISVVRMLGELDGVTHSGAAPWWSMLIPIYSIYIALVVVPAEVTRAKQMLRVQEPTRNIVLYLFLFLYALAADLNDMARGMQS
jgi:glucan phosphoethanolaminetransferase (alkaline phosphatase superfamily)